MKNTDKIVIALSLIGLVSFFLPWIQFLGKVSGLTIVQEGLRYEEYQVALLMILPLSFLLIALMRMGIFGKQIKVIEFVPLLFVLYIIYKIADTSIEYLIEHLPNFLEDLLTSCEPAFYAMLIAAIVIVFIPTNKIENSKNQ